MAKEEQVDRAHCPRCDREQRCDELGAKDVEWEHREGEHAAHGKVRHRLLQCRGCEEVFYWRESWDSEDFDVVWDAELGSDTMVTRKLRETFPVPEQEDQRPDWYWRLHQHDRVLQAIMDEMYKAADTGSYMLASVGLRTALDRAMEKLGIHPGDTLGNKIQALMDQGFVGATEKDVLDTVADVGNAAAHRGWHPDRDEFRLLLTALEGFVHRTVVQGKQALEIKAQVPVRHPRPRRSPGSA